MTGVANVLFLRQAILTRLSPSLFVLCLSACGASSDKTASSESQDAIKPGDRVDIDGDGMFDGTAVDVNNDGLPDGVDTDGDGKPDVKLDGSPYPVAKPEPPGCTGGSCEPPPNAPDCPTLPAGAKTTKTNVMFLVDGSKSMQSYWTSVKVAMADIINANPNLNFGVHMFHAEGADLASFVRALNACGEIKHTRVEVNQGQGQAIVDFMGNAPPGAGNNFFDRSPVLAGLNWYLQNDTPLDDVESANFLVVFSDLVDTCFGTLFSNPGSISNSAGSEQLLAFEKLAVELRKKHMKVIPVGFDSNPSNNSNAGADGDVNQMALASLTSYGGSTIKTPLLARSEADVKKVIEEIGRAVQPCRFSLPDVAAGGVNGFNVLLSIDGRLVPRDRSKTEGWDFVESKLDEVELYGEACKALQSGTAKLTVTPNCTTDRICGIGQTQITTRTRALHIALDGSGSMQGGLNGWFGALFQDKLTPWGEATAAIAQMVTDPGNDDLEFGFQFFPKSAEGGCKDIGPAEVPIGQGNEITIISQLLSNVPTGSTPLVGVLEHIAANPGRLLDPGVEGNVLIVSDGEDSCAAANTRNQQLANASNSLYQRGAKTFAVKFDSGSSSAAQEDQLTNIALNGGTQTYLNAPNGAGLTMALESVTSGLSSCDLTIGSLPAEVDPNQVNVYLNGIPVPYDVGKTKMSGWGWTSDTSANDYSSLELYGEHCQLLQKSRLDDIVLELGCARLDVQ